MNQLDHLRDNWWCQLGPREAQPFESPALHKIYGGRKSEARFLTQEQKGAAKKETTSLAGAPMAPVFLGEETLRWANAHPNDPRLPEALYRVVRATRYSCADPSVSQISKRAFTLLHQRFPNSEWTKKTPYYF